jgi:hypothetical protein
MSEQGTKGANDAGRAVPEVDDFGKVYCHWGSPATGDGPGDLN